MGLRAPRVTTKALGSPGLSPGFEDNHGDGFRLKTQSVKPASLGSLGLFPKTSQRRKRGAKERPTSEISADHPRDPGASGQPPVLAEETSKSDDSNPRASPGDHPGASRVGPWILAIPIRLGRGGNDRGSWRARHGRTKGQRKAVHLLWPWTWKQRTWASPLLVTLTRVSPSSKPLDDDNLAASLKAVRDQVAAELGVDDGDRQRIRFLPQQERGAWGVRIEIREATP